jgi:hypothetical protein
MKVVAAEAVQTICQDAECISVFGKKEVSVKLRGAKAKLPGQKGQNL